MNLAIIGYGKMGKMVEQAAIHHGHLITAKIGPGGTHLEMTAESLRDADLCIEFTHPKSVLDNIRKAAHLGKNIVVGTTGWYDQLHEVKTLINQAGIGLLYSPNFSIGIALFLQMIAHAAKLIAPFDTFDIGGIEMHHRQKADSPSGTAQAIVQKLLNHIPRKTRARYHHNNDIAMHDEIHFESLRLGSIPGTHTVYFDSPAETITLTHSAKNREGFAEGALRAAEWLKDKQGFYHFDEVFDNFTIETQLAPLNHA